ncbi:MAG: RsmE family RNA methyltransferase [Phycisphaera sp.]|nr:RsmE family RNA methyltransferase [Phycisphaera sp.]
MTNDQAPMTKACRNARVWLIGHWCLVIGHYNASMSKHRFYVADLGGAAITLDRDESKHAVRSLRVAVDDLVELFDGAGAVGVGRVTEARSGAVTIEVTQRKDVPRVGPWVEIASAVPKGARADTLVEKVSECGCDRLVPMLTKRSVVDPRAGKQDRWSRMAVESAKQCGRAWLMQIAEPTPFERVIAGADHDVKLIAHTVDASADARVTVQELHTRIAGATRVLALIGPEGGWADEELSAALAEGFTPVSLGPHVMRIETAAIAAAILLRA